MLCHAEVLGDVRRDDLANGLFTFGAALIGAKSTIGCCYLQVPGSRFPALRNHISTSSGGENVFEAIQLREMVSSNAERSLTRSIFPRKAILAKRLTTSVRPHACRAQSSRTWSKLCVPSRDLQVYKGTS